MFSPPPPPGEFPDDGRCMLCPYHVIRTLHFSFLHYILLKTFLQFLYLIKIQAAFLYFAATPLPMTEVYPGSFYMEVHCPVS